MVAANKVLSPGEPASVGVNMEGAEYSWVGYPALADLQNVKSEGVNLVRLPIAWEMMQPTLNGPLSASYLDGLKTFLNNAASLGIGVVVDLHDFGRYDLNWAADAAANHGIEAPNGSDASVLGSAAVPISAFANFWQQLATALQGNPGVAGYDIMNEPNNMPTPQTWPTAAQAAVNAIRTVDMNTPIIVEGDEWASAQYWMSYNANLKITDPANDIIYQAHSYFDNGSGTYSKTYAQQGDTPQTGVQDVAPFLQWLKTNGYRGFVGELGVPSNDPQWIPLLNNVLSDLQANGVSATVWNYEMPDSSPAWWVSNIESTSPANLNIAPVKGVVTPQMALIHSLNGASADPAPTVVITSAGGTVTSAAQTITGTVDVADADSTVTVLDGTTQIGTATVVANGGWSANVTLVNQGANVLTATDSNSAGTGTSNSITDMLQSAGTSPTLSIASSTVHVTEGGTASLGISVSAPAGATATTVNFSGLPKYERITDSLDHKTWRGGNINLTEAEVNSGVSVQSYYHGSGNPTATLTIGAADTVGGVTVASAPQTITVIDPPPSTSTSSAGDPTDGGATNGTFTFEPLTGAHLLADLASPAVGVSNDNFALTSSEFAAAWSLLASDKNMGAHFATGAAYGEKPHLLGLNLAAYAGPKAESVLHG